VAFSLAHTIAQDNTDDAAQQAKTREAYDYLYDTFLPARGWVTTNDGTNRRRWQMPVLNAIDGNSAAMMYGWSQYTGSTLVQYEDSTYTTVPGDLGTDTTNSISNGIWASSDSYRSLDFKYWTSDEDLSLWMFTQGTKLRAWGAKFLVNIYEENTTFPTAPNVDTHKTHLFHPSYNFFYFTNQPYGLGDNLNEQPLYLNNTATKYTKPDGFAFAKNPTFYLRLNSTGFPIAQIAESDIRYKIAEPNFRTTTMIDENNLVTGLLEKYFVNGTDWWVSSGGPADPDPRLAFNFGTTEPDFT